MPSEKVQKGTQSLPAVRLLAERRPLNGMATPQKNDSQTGGAGERLCHFDIALVFLVPASVLSLHCLPTEPESNALDSLVYPVKKGG